MSALSVNPAYPIFTEADGLPLENGYILIGQKNLNPQTNPITVYWDADLTIPAVQPIRTLGGYPVYNGSPGRIYADSDYSIRVLNKNGVLVYSAPAATERFDASVISVSFTTVDAVGDGLQLSFAIATQPQFIYIDGVYQNRNTYTYFPGNVVFSEAPPLNSVIEFVV